MGGGRRVHSLLAAGASLGFSAALLSAGAELSAVSFFSLFSPPSSVRPLADALDEDLLSVIYQPLPLKWMAGGLMRRRTCIPWQLGQDGVLLSEND